MNRFNITVVVGVSVIAGTVTLLAACSSDSSAGNPNTNVQADASSPEGGTVVDGTPTPRSGSRLRVVRYKAAGNAYAESSLRDTELGPCTPMYLADGSIRCVPATGGAQLVFRDSGCTEPFALGGAQCTSSFAISGRPSAVVCDTPSKEKARVWAVKAPIPAPVEYYEPRSDGTCEKYDVWEGSSTYAVEEVPSSQMVALERKDESVGRVALRLLTSEDGLRYPIGLADVATGKSCSLTARTSDGQVPEGEESTVVACIPGTAATSAKYASSGEYVAYADSSCTAAAANAGEDACTSTPSFVRSVTIPAEACAPPTVANHALGPRLSSSFLKSGDTCSAQAPFGTMTYWAVGGTLNLSSFAPVNRTVIGTDKARSVTYAVDGKTLFEGEGSFRQGPTFCSPREREGITYCVPFGTLATPPANGPGPYADDKCTRPAVTKMILTPSCGSTPLVAEYVLPTGGCTPTSASLGRVFDLGAEIASVYIRPQGGECQPQQGQGGPPLPGGPTYYEVGAERNPADVFATLERTELTP